MPARTSPLPSYLHDNRIEKKSRIHPFNEALDAGFFQNTYRGVVKIEKRTQRGIYFLQGFIFFLRIKAIIPEGALHGKVVFLFDKTVVILVIRSASVKSDLLLTRP